MNLIGPYTLEMYKCTCKFVQKKMWVAGKRRRARPHKEDIFRISINSQVDIAMSIMTI